jgi:hypothetical protein
MMERLGTIDFEMVWNGRLQAGPLLRTVGSINTTANHQKELLNIPQDSHVQLSDTGPVGETVTGVKILEAEHR